MTISNQKLDTWAANDIATTQMCTIIIVSLCFLISLILFIIRFQQVLSSKSMYTTSKNERRLLFSQILLNINHLLAMFFSCFYIFLYIWNYLHLYIDTNQLSCEAWFIMIMISITSTKIFLYSFLMLRSSLAFRGSLFSLPLTISIPITSISACTQITMMGLMLSDFESYHPPWNESTRSVCFRILGPRGIAGMTGFNLNDMLSGFFALIIFWYKARSVKKLLNALQCKDNTDDKTSGNNPSSDLNSLFNKNIKLGCLIVFGSILIFFVGEFLTILMGAASALHQLANNIYIFLLFGANDACYDRICCKVSSVSKNEEILGEHLDNQVRMDLSTKQQVGISYDVNESRSKDTFKSNKIMEFTPIESLRGKQFLSHSLSSIPPTATSKQKKNDKTSQSSICLKAINRVSKFKPFSIKVSNANSKKNQLIRVTSQSSDDNHDIKAVSSKRKYTGSLTLDNNISLTPMTVTPMTTTSMTATPTLNTSDDGSSPADKGAFHLFQASAQQQQQTKFDHLPVIK